MLMSMSGFGRASYDAEGKRITVEVKSLNSKQLDLNMRLPSIFREQDIELRSLVLAELERGKVDLCVTVESVGGTPSCSRINIEAMAEYKRQLEEAGARLGLGAPADWYALLLRLPDAVVTDTSDDATEVMREALTAATRQALGALKEHRRSEGVRLESFFAQRIEAIGSLLSEVEPYEAERVPKIRTRIEEALSKIPVADYDKGRLEQEMIFYIEKLDVNEEKQRLRQHLRYFTETMNGTPGQGKKLGFIAQEMGREINTLGSKSNHAEMQCLVVKMKDCLEQIKEQVLNVM